MPDATRVAVQASGVFARSRGWVAFGLIMAASLGALANLPRGIATYDQSHPVALTVATAVWAVCWGTARVARRRGADSWPLRPVTLRVVALISAFAISTLVSWHAEQQNQQQIGEHFRNVSSVTTAH